MTNVGQIGIRQLFVLTSVVALVFAGVYKESANIAFATCFCVVSIACISGLMVVSTTHFVNAVRASWQVGSLTPLVARIKWLMVDIFIASMCVAAIAVANFILENCETNGPRWLLMGSCLTIPPAMIWTIARWKRSRARSEEF